LQPTLAVALRILRQVDFRVAIGPGIDLGGQADQLLVTTFRIADLPGTQVQRYVALAVLRLIPFLGLVLSLLAAVAVYVHRRVVRTFRLGRTGRRVLAIGLALSLVSAVLSRVCEGRPWSGLLEPVGLLAFAVALALLFVLLPLALLQLGWGVGRALGARCAPRAAAAREPRRVSEPTERARAVEPSASTPDPSGASLSTRRSFLEQASVGTALAAGLGLSLYGTYIGRRNYVLEEQWVRISGLPTALDGFVLAQLSDVHIGLFVGPAELAVAEDLVRAVQADLVVITGDLIDHDARYAPLLERFAARLTSHAPHGAVAIPGNHDYYTGIDETVAALERAGVQVLRNQGTLIGPPNSELLLLGLDDVWGPRVDPRSQGPDLNRAMASVPNAASKPRILLCHNPVYFSHAAGRVALQLSGHTHGGQIYLGQGLTSHLLGHPYLSGRYRLRGTDLYVNRGFGTAGPPARLGSRPEVTRIVLTAR